MTTAEDKLRAAGADDTAVAAFARQLERVRAGESGLLRECDIEPVSELPDAQDLPDVAATGAAAEALGAAVVLKLNGGLGTSMGLSGPKSLLQVKEGMTFLDLIARQVVSLRESTGARLPLVLMNSFVTQAPSLEALARHRLEQDVPPDFVQNKVPKLVPDTLEPVQWPADPDLEWAPPGHGDLYPSLVGSGMLDALVEHGYRWCFVSNSDNLGAVLDPRILAWFAESGAPFAMEVADRTAADRKGGHLAVRRAGGGLVLREVAMCPEEDLDAFQDVTKHRYFNTNNLWLDLHAIRDTGGVVDLPLILNRKTVDSKDSGSPKVIQLETAMGAAIDALPGAQAIRVPRTRMAPVKTTNDLLALRSDAYVVDERSVVVLDDRRAGSPPDVDLDPSVYKLVGEFEQRFPLGAPSLVECRAIRVRGDVTFGAGVVVRGTVEVEGPRKVPDGTVLGD